MKLSFRNNEKQHEGEARISLGRIIGKKNISKKLEAEKYIIEGNEILNKVKLKPWLSQGYFFL